MDVVPNLHFNGECEKAIELYERAFGAERTAFLRYEDANPLDGDQASSEADRALVYHAEILIGDRRIILNDHPNDIPSGINVSLLISFDSVEEVKRAYEVLRADAEILSPMTETTYSSCFVSLVDRYGVRWELMKET
jgi:PhnB protein